MTVTKRGSFNFKGFLCVCFFLLFFLKTGQCFELGWFLLKFLLKLYYVMGGSFQEFYSKFSIKRENIL